MTGVWVERTWSVALFGHFNPAITTAKWLAEAGVFAGNEERSAVHSGDATATAIRAGELTFEITLERFLLQTTDETFVGRLESVVSLVFDTLRHTPIESLAMGLDAEWSGEQRTDRDRVLGQLLLPAGHLEDLLGPTQARSATLRFGGITGPTALCHVTLEDSDESPNGVYLSLVDEVGFGEDASIGAGAAVECLKNRWREFVLRADEVVQALVGRS